MLQVVPHLQEIVIVEQQDQVQFTGYYGTLTLEADGSYTYVANTDIATGLDTGLTVTDVFTYTLTDIEDGDKSNPATATITITIVGLSAPTAENNTATVEENSSITVANGASSNSETAATHSVDDREAV